MNKISILLIVSLLCVFSCKKNDDSSGGDWAIPSDQVFDGGPGKDGIPSVDNPIFIDAGLVDFLDPDDLIIAVEVDGEVRGYPHRILDWHEIVNDEIKGLPLAITYCPLTGTGTAWKRKINGVTTTFGVSGLLYNTNIIPYDRETDSNWAQMLLRAVKGEMKGQKIETYPVLETTWATYQSRWADSKVMSTETGFNRNYSQYPYGDYRTNNYKVIFPLEVDDDRRPRKERGLGVIINGKAKFYGFENFPGPDIVVWNDVFEGKNLVLFGSQDKNFIIAFESKLEDGTPVSFPLATDQVIKDVDGNIWSVFGEAKEGPFNGQHLVPVDNFIGYWFSWGAFYPGLEIK